MRAWCLFSFVTGHANYFRRLFRDIFIDATLFVMEEKTDTQ